MSSENNKTVVRRMFEDAWNQGNLSAVDELLAADATDHHDPDVPSFPEHLKAQIAASRRAFPDLRFTIEEMIAEGDLVACRLTLSGTHQGVFNGIPPTGRHFIQEHMHMIGSSVAKARITGRCSTRWGCCNSSARSRRRERWRSRRHERISNGRGWGDTADHDQSRKETHNELSECHISNHAADFRA